MISRRDLLVGSGMLLASARPPLLASSLFAPEAFPVDPAQDAAAFPWVRSARILACDAYNPPFYPLLEYDPARAVAIAQAIHANALRYPAASYVAYFPTKTKYPIHPQLRGDPLLETIRLCRAANIRTIGYIPVNHPFMPVGATNPDFSDWQRRDIHGNPFITTHFGWCDFYEGCLNSPLRAQILALLHEVLAYDIDLIYFDGPYQGMDQRLHFCHCKYCRAAYRAAHGRDIPAEDGPAADVIAYTHWMDIEVCKAFLQQMVSIVRAEKRLPVFYNNTSLLNRGWCRSRSFPVVDGFMYEAAATPEQKLFNLQLGQSTGKCIWTYAGDHSKYNREHLVDKSIRGWYSYPLDGQDLLMDGAVALAAGTGVVFWSLSRFHAIPRPPLDLAEGRNVRDIFAAMDAHPELFTAVSSPQAGVLVGSQTLESYNSPSFVLAAYQNGFRGIWAAMQQGSFTAEPFLDIDFDAARLARYQLVWVSNAACLSAAQCALLADFAAAGGTLIATHRSGLCDENGRPLVVRPLHGLLGIAFTADVPVEKPELYLQLPNHADLIPQDPQIMPFRALEGTEVLATTYDLAHRLTLGPAITRRAHGRGQVFYIGSNLEAIYTETQLPPVRDLLLSLLGPVLAASRRYRLAPTPGLTAHYRESANTLTLHLLADTGDKLKETRATENFLPLTAIDVALRVPSGRKVAAVSLLRAGTSLPVNERDGWLHATVPSILLHEAVVVTLA